MIPKTPPPRAAARIPSSDLQPATPGASALQLECVMKTGFFDKEIASRLVAGPQCETPIAIPIEFIRATTSAPNAVSPLSWPAWQPLPRRLPE